MVKISLYKLTEKEIDGLENVLNSVLGEKKKGIAARSTDLDGTSKSGRIFRYNGGEFRARLEEERFYLELDLDQNSSKYQMVLDRLRVKVPKVYNQLPKADRYGKEVA